MKTILIAEDTESNYLLVNAMIGKTYRLIHVQNGLEVIEALKESIPDLILLDIKMPCMDGIETLKFVKANYPGIPVIMQSAFVFDENIKEALSLGGNAYITKPFTKKQLSETIEKFI